MLYKTNENFSKECDIPSEDIEKAVCGDFDEISFDDVTRIRGTLGLNFVFALKRNISEKSVSSSR